MVYFAYGSNMNWPQMRQRCPSARFITVARLKDYRLRFPLKSKSRGCGAAGALPESGQTVWGVAYEIDEREVVSLDEAEDYVPGREQNSYWRKESPVYPGTDGEAPLVVWLYLPEPEENPPPPSPAYKRLIVEGATFWSLPQDYIRQLEAITVAV
jgi:gamma-glutamylcyclotransferase